MSVGNMRPSDGQPITANPKPINRKAPGLRLFDWEAERDRRIREWTVEQRRRGDVQ